MTDRQGEGLRGCPGGALGRDGDRIDAAGTGGGGPGAAVPLPLSEKLTPAGRAPASVSAGTGYPVVLTVKENVEPTVAVELAVDVIAGLALTVRRND